MPDKCPGGKYPGAVAYDPQPPKSDPIWGGHTDGGIYSGAGWCIDGVQYLGPWIRWLAINPAAAAPVVTPGQLARDAFASLTMPAPKLYRSPSEDKRSPAPALAVRGRRAMAAPHPRPEAAASATSRPGRR